jgi:IS605 OrfB family transposase
MSIKTRKIKLIPVGETAADRTKVYKYIKEIAQNLAEVGNRIIRLHVNNLYELEDLVKDQNLTKKDATDVLTKRFGTSLQNTGYRLTTEYNNIASEIRTGFNQNIYGTLRNNFFDIKNGKMSIPSFRKTNINIPFSATGNKNKDENGGTKTLYLENDIYQFNLPMTVSEKKIHGNMNLNLFLGKDKSNNKAIIERLISGEYHMCDSTIQVKDNELYLLLTYKQDDKVISNDKTKTMGVDIGINRPVSFYINNTKHQPDQINIGLKIQHERMKFYKHRRSLQQTIKYSKGGHGKTRKTQALNDLKEKEANWSQLINHTISRELIKLAQDNNVGTIKLEDLTGITTDTKHYFLKSWAYYQLQTYIEYKAKELGINILWVKAKNTSNTCPTCGNSDPLNRNDIDRTKFRCISINCKDYDKEKDADIVGAYNICHADGELVKGNSKAGKLEKNKKKNAIENLA